MAFTTFPTLSSIMARGLPTTDQILVSGPPGSGKSILAMQFIQDGVMSGQNGVFFTLENSRQYIIDQMAAVGLDAASYIAEGKMDVVRLDPVDIYVMLDDMERHVARLGAKRIVLDSLSVLAVYCASYRNMPEDLIAFLEKTQYPPPIAMGGAIKKQMLYAVLSRIRALGCTTLLISELSRGSKWFSRDRVSEFVCDGIILLDYNLLGAAGMTRTISVVKMRRGDYVAGVHEFRIAQKGFVIES